MHSQRLSLRETRLPDQRLQPEGADKPAFSDFQAQLAPPTLGDYKIPWERPKSSLSPRQKFCRHLTYNLKKLAARILPGQSVRQVRLSKYEACLPGMFRKAITGNMNLLENRDTKKFVSAVERAVALGPGKSKEEIDAKGRYGEVLEVLIQNEFPGENVPIGEALTQIQKILYTVAQANEKSTDFNPLANRYHHTNHALNKIAITKLHGFLAQRRHEFRKQDLPRLDAIGGIVGHMTAFSSKQFNEKMGSNNLGQLGKAEPVKALEQSLLRTYGNEQFNADARNVVTHARFAFLLSELVKLDFTKSGCKEVNESLSKILCEIDLQNPAVLKNAVAELRKKQEWQIVELVKNINLIPALPVMAKKILLEEIGKLPNAPQRK
jgi:hypothetical protein